MPFHRQPSYTLLLGLLVGTLLLSGCDTGGSSSGRPDSDVPLDGCTIPTSQIVDGGVGKDGIPALTNPPLVDPDAESAQYLADTSRVIGLVTGDRSLAVPHNILWHHEIVNLDDWGGDPIAVTYCPLTGSSIAFDRTAVDGAEFGVSGLLFENNLVVYDRREDDSLWPQMNRQANCGPATGTTLPHVPVVEMTWDRWQELHPDTKVVSRNTGYGRNYRPTGYPYDDYEQLHNERLLFQGTPIDDRRPPKERVLGIPDGHGGGLAFPFGVLDAQGPLRVVETAAAGTRVVVFWSRDARSAMAFETTRSFAVEDDRIVDTATGSSWTITGRAVAGPRSGDQLEPVEEAYVSFWFAWAVFQPESALWSTPPS